VEENIRFWMKFMGTRKSGQMDGLCEQVIEEIGLTAVAGLTACSSGGSAADVPEANLSGSPVTVEEDLTDLCAQIVEQALPLEAAVALAEASGYQTRVTSTDGVPEAATMDARDDRFSFVVVGGSVTECTIG